MGRISIGSNYEHQASWKKYLGIPLIYFPILVTIPFVIIGVMVVRIHLKYVGGMNIRSYWSFVPTWISHRYQYDNQITYESETTHLNWRSFRWYWIFNCKIYCPMSVALFRYFAYLTMVVENWWCPFTHDKKQDYADAAIDYSYWHIRDSERNKMHPDDRNNPLWNQDVQDEPDLHKKKDSIDTTDVN
ncbi:MAG: hypothetical protein OEY52_17475 [Gammaproteobacteria bacterium]|nr:hypothetical protein [Gammaproteobacteria bacterium]